MTAAYGDDFRIAIALHSDAKNMSSIFTEPASQYLPDRVARRGEIINPPLLARSLIGLLSVFGFSTFSLYVLWKTGPIMADRRGDTGGMQFPSSFEQLRRLTSVLLIYRDQNYAYILLLFSAAYLYKQTFAIPGSLFMNVLAGALFGRWQSAAIVCPLTAVGASGCFLISRTFAEPLVERCFGSRLLIFRQKVRENHHRLLYFLLFARVFPFSPNWLINICSPFVHIPLKTFFISVLFGLAPYNILCVEAGGLISELHSASQIVNFWTILELGTIAMVVLLFGLLVKRRNQ